MDFNRSILKMEWIISRLIGREAFEITLNKKGNLDLCQLFFEVGKELEYFSDTIPKKKRESFRNEEYLELETSCNQHFFRG